jgi:hypothetical protein
MPQRIKPDVLQALQDWQAGKPVKSLELGHVHRMTDVPGFGPKIDLSVRLYNDQERAHAYLFHILSHFAHITELTGLLPHSHENFLTMCDTIEAEFRKNGNLTMHPEAAELTAEEMDGAESLAWKALHVGWARAIAGHDASRYIEITNRAVVAAT